MTQSQASSGLKLEGIEGQLLSSDDAQSKVGAAWVVVSSASFEDELRAKLGALPPMLTEKLGQML